MGVCTQADQWPIIMVMMDFTTFGMLFWIVVNQRPTTIELEFSQAKNAICTMIATTLLVTQPMLLSMDL